MPRSACRTCARLAAAVSALLFAAVALAELPQGVTSREIQIWSDGTRLAGDLFWPESWKEGEKLPAIVLCHGWGGTKDHLNVAYAPQFAARGYFVLTFDYRGWGESDGRLVAVGDIPEPDADGVVTVRAREIRDVVSPVERIADIEAAISWLELEPGVDRNRIGLWGTSFGGGNVVAVAALDKRVKCVVSQVGDLNTRWGWVHAMEQRLAATPKAVGTPQELDREYDEVTQRLASRAGEVERLLRTGNIALDMRGLLVMGEKAKQDAKVAQLVEAQNRDTDKLCAILANTPERADEILLTQRAQRARGLIDPFPQGVGYGTLPPMSGIADLTQMVQYAAVDMADEVNVPVLILEAGKEELMDPAFGTALLERKLKGRVPVKREVFEGVSHFDIYRPPALERARSEALAWFDTYLGGPHGAARAEIMETMERMGEAYADRDIDGYMAYISDHFTSHHQFDKAGFRAYLEQAWQALEWSSTVDYGSLTVDGDHARLMSTSISDMGRFPTPINLAREADGVWRVVSYE